MISAERRNDQKPKAKYQILKEEIMKRKLEELLAVIFGDAGQRAAVAGEENAIEEATALARKWKEDERGLALTRQEWEETKRELAAARKLLSEAGGVFRRYEDRHRRKGTPEGFNKAEENARWAERCEAEAKGGNPKCQIPKTKAERGLPEAPKGWAGSLGD